MSSSIPHDARRRMAAVVVVFAVLAAGVAAILALQARGGRSGSDLLGDVVDPDTGDVTTYAITYRTVFADGDPVEELLEVVRPFRSRLTSGRTAQITDAGVFATTGDGVSWVRTAVPIAPAAPDARWAGLGDAVDSGLVAPLGPRAVHGRDCEAYELGGPVSAGVFTPLGAVSNESAEICIDALGLVLSETWTVDGATARTREAIAISFDPIDPGRFALPSATAAVAGDDGGASVEVIDAVVDPGFPEHWAPARVPAGFAFVDRWAVSLPTADGGLVMLVTDAWRRGADLLLVDQGVANNDAPPPWSRDDRGTDVDLGELGTGRLVVGLGSNEVRAVRPDGGFVRLAATLPPAEVVAAARTLVRSTGAGR